MKNSAPSAGRQQIAGERHRDRVRRGHAVLKQQEDAGEPGYCGGQNEGGELVTVGRIAEKARALFVLADRNQHVADARMMETP
jgi:hypothetical protein